ncbi:acyl carrier protein [Streptomyces sp. PTM05]|uniref:Acyl carrier protein n=1 Tax=Streptantibioticus parmotrematis TaxID=2873249 RepID=A0ABS7QQR6_9ACTN|nr:acyl carrier protein [Streptantibioticus parmotrematis]MBY8884715.1 acyl carrier protein [Streptantibioticus parmotrematis]
MPEQSASSGTIGSLDGDPETVITAVWAEALGVESLDPHTGFFDLGATSATVVSVAKVLRQRWPRVRVVDLFSHSTPAQLAVFLGDG